VTTFFISVPSVDSFITLTSTSTRTIFSGSTIVTYSLTSLRSVTVTATSTHVVPPLTRTATTVFDYTALYTLPLVTSTILGTVLDTATFFFTPLN